MNLLTVGEQLTCRFYAWEARGRGWLLYDAPVELEPPFVPFMHRLPTTTYVDDGRKPTMLGSLADFIAGRKRPVAKKEDDLDYDELDPYLDVSDHTNIGLQIKFPRDRSITVEAMKALLTMLSSEGSMLSFEIIGTAKEIAVQFVCPVQHALTIEAQLFAFFPRLSIVRTDKNIDGILEQGLNTQVIDFGLRDEFIRPIAVTKNFKPDPLTGLVGVLETLCGEERGGMQILFAGAVNGWSPSILRSASLADGSSFFKDAPESPRLAQEKTQSPLFAVTIRAFGQAKDEQASGSILARICHTIRRSSASDHNMLITLDTDAYDFQARIDDIYLRTSHRLGMLLSTDELLTLLHFPSEYIHSKKLLGGSRKTRALLDVARGHRFKLGINVHNDKEEPATVSAEQRLKHTHIIGATGTGKSTLLRSMINQDIELGNGIAVLDPHGDLIESILSIIPTSRMKDVVLVDPADGEYPVGFNILQAHSEIEKEVLSSDLVAVFKRNSTSWGDQMNSVFANAVIAFLESTKGGSLADLRRFLIEKKYREEFLETVTDPSIKYYWLKEYPVLKTNSVGPILTRLDTFLRPKLIRNMVCQQKGLDFEKMMDSQQILLVKLSQGLIGEENSNLLGSFVVAKIHQAALSRQAKQDRKDFFCYIDEFHHFLTPSMSGILSGTRKYHLGLILAHQDLQQLKKSDSDIASSVLANAGTRICLRVGDDDAKKLAEGFASFDAEDLQNLETGEAIARIARPTQDFSFTVDPVTAEFEAQVAQQIIDYSRRNYGTPKKDVEALLAQTMFVPPDEPRQRTQNPKEQSGTSQQPESTNSQSSSSALPVDRSLGGSSQQSQESVKESISKRKENSQHRYLQTLIKKMAESKGYKATIEALTPDASGKVDVLIEKGTQSIACEVSVTTDLVWELHNIKKCLAAGYEFIASCVGSEDKKRLLEQKISEYCPKDVQEKIRVFLPDELFAYLDQLESAAPEVAEAQQNMKGYRVTVTYDAVTNEQQKQKKESIARIVSNHLRSKKDK